MKLTLDTEREKKVRRAVWAVPDSLYRRAARRMIARLLKDNRRLRRERDVALQQLRRMNITIETKSKEQ